MPNSKPLSRLLRIRELEEEQSRRALEAALGEMNRIDSVLGKTAEQEKSGRRLVTHSVRTGDSTGLVAGLEESRLAHNRAESLKDELAAIERLAVQQREHFLSAGIRRRQAETLVEESCARAEAEQSRRRQLDLDDWHRSSSMRARERTQH